MNAAPGQLAHYHLSRCIGVGGMGAVYEARHAVLKRSVAIKTLLEGCAGNDALRGRFLREAEIAARVRHAHIVDIYDAGIEAGVPYLVMELLEGETLAAQLEREGRMISNEAVNVALPLVAALVEVHRRGIAHCDIKPENVFLSIDAQGDMLVKLLDFGVSKDLALEPTQTGSDVAPPSTTRLSWPMIEGTPEYMAPEQLRSQPVVDARTDQYALGVLLYQSLSGVRPFAAGSLLETAYRVCEGDFQPLASFRPDLPAGLLEVVGRAMAPRMEDRFPTIEALGEALLPFASADVALAYEREFRRERRSADPLSHRSWLPPPRRAARVADSRAQLGMAPTLSMAAKRATPIGAFVRSALITAVLMIAGLASWISCAEPSRKGGADSVPAAASSETPSM